MYNSAKNNHVNKPEKDGCDHTPKKTRNPEKDPKKTLFSTKFCLYFTIILFYILVCVPNMYLQVYFM